MKQNNHVWGIYSRLLSYVWPYRWVFLLAIVGNVLYGVVDAALIKLLKPLIDKGFVDRNTVFIQWIPFIVIGIFLLRGCASFLSTFCMGWVGRNVVMNIRQAMFVHLLKLPASYYDRTVSGETLSKLTFNVEQVANASADALTELIRESFLTVGLVAVMFSESWRLTLLFIVTVPFMAWIIHVVNLRMRKISTCAQDSMGVVTHVIEEALKGHKVIKAFGGQSYELSRFVKVTQHNRRQEMKLITTSAISVPVIQLIGAFALVTTIYLATHNAITPGSFATMITAMLALLKPIKQLTRVSSNLQKGLAAATSIFRFLDEKTEPDVGQAVIVRSKGHLLFREVSFRYTGVLGNALDSISFEVQPGETIAIVGRSGGGKSTLVNLLPRFYEASGNIFIDNVAIEQIPLAQLRKQISIVSQQVTLFNGTIFHNIAYGEKTPTREAVIAAAKSAYLLDFINKLPNGLDTMVGENGVRLSGGQRQRLAIARAILKNAPILILDEATSALDTESERYIQAALGQLMAQCTTLVIAHRLSTIENANRILVIDKGRIVEMGTHAALIKQNGLYATLRVMQYQDKNEVFAC